MYSVLVEEEVEVPFFVHWAVAYTAYWSSLVLLASEVLKVYAAPAA